MFPGAIRFEHTEIPHTAQSKIKFWDEVCANCAIPVSTLILFLHDQRYDQVVEKYETCVTDFRPYGLNCYCNERADWPRLVDILNAQTRAFLPND